MVMLSCKNCKYSFCSFCSSYKICSVVGLFGEFNIHGTSIQKVSLSVNASSFIDETILMHLLFFFFF